MRTTEQYISTAPTSLWDVLMEAYGMALRVTRTKDRGEQTPGVNQPRQPPWVHLIVIFLFLSAFACNLGS